MAKRIITSVIGLPVLTFFVAYGGYPLKIALAVLALLGMKELYAALSGKMLPVHIAGLAAAAVYILTLGTADSSSVLLAVTMLLTLSAVVFSVFFYGRINIMDSCVAVFGFFYVAVMLSAIYLVRSQPYGLYSCWLIFLSAWGCDTGAYFTGINLGKRKLAPSLSPNKTVEGSIGGSFFAAVLCFVYGLVLCLCNVFTIGYAFMFALIGLGGSVFAQLGDLAASAIKRHTSIKDFGAILPGHGGVLDRFDSILFAAPFVYLTSLILLK